MTVFFTIFTHGALIAYIIKTGEFLNALLSPLFGGTVIFYSVIFAALSFMIIHKGIKLVEKMELYMVMLILVVIITLSIFLIPNVDTNNLTSFSINKLFIPYGIVFFAFLATPAIPEINEELKNNKKDLKQAIINGSVIPIFDYLLFAIIVVVIK